MNGKALWWLDYKREPGGQKASGRPFQPSGVSWLVPASTQTGAQDGKLIFENLRKEGILQEIWVTFMIRKINIRKRNKTCDHPCFFVSDFLLWRLRTAGEQECFSPSVPPLPGPGPATEEAVFAELIVE